MSGGLTLCRQLRPSSRRELVSASNSHVLGKKMGGGKPQGKKNHESQTLGKLIKACTVQLLSKTLNHFRFNSLKKVL